jgi:peptidoglycan/xylan/chitin deacetylase (PgdA/CDA1 family)
MASGRGALTISIDLELAWGVWDKLTADELRLTETEERQVCADLIDLFDRYQVAATWAMVAALLDAKSSDKRPGSRSCWYAPDIVDKLVRARAPHEIGSHSGRHVYFGSIDGSQAREDLAFAADVHRTHSLAFESFVFPRNAVGHLDALAQAGVRTFRGPDVGWPVQVHRFGTTVGRAANLADKFLPLAPPSVRAERRDGMVDIPGSMLLIGRNGLRRFVLPVLTRAKLAAGLRRAQVSGGVFHLWFHPSNFYHRREEQLATVAWFLEHAAAEAGSGRLDIRTMGSWAVH